jgi:AcrR family transcriptional regulator
MSTGRRSYSSTRRQEQADATRRQIVAAASRLFIEQGYAATTVEAVATAAGVSLQTVYNAVGGKPVLLKSAYDVLLAGDDDPIAMIERPSYQALLASADGRTALRRYAAIANEIGERVAPLVGMVLAQAAAGDRDLQAFAATIEGERAIGTSMISGFVAERFGLRRGLSRARAADVLWTFTAPDIRHRLVEVRGWSVTQFEKWLAQAMADALLGPDR